MFDKIYKVLYYTLVVVLMATALVFLFSILPISGNYQIKIVKSGSMEPAIRTGSVVIVKSFKDYKIGEVITFGKDTKNIIPTTHRIVEMKIESGVPIYITRGDANSVNDSSEVLPKNIIGSVVFSIPILGYLLDFARKPIGFILMVVMPAIIVVFDEISKIWKALKEFRKKKEINIEVSDQINTNV